jgi:hypothetical protein
VAEYALTGYITAILTPYYTLKKRSNWKRNIWSEIIVIVMIMFKQLKCIRTKVPSLLCYQVALRIKIEEQNCRSRDYIVVLCAVSAISDNRVHRPKQLRRNFDSPITDFYENRVESREECDVKWPGRRRACWGERKCRIGSRVSVVKRERWECVHGEGGVCRRALRDEGRCESEDLVHVQWYLSVTCQEIC